MNRNMITAAILTSMMTAAATRAAEPAPAATPSTQPHSKAAFTVRTVGPIMLNTKTEKAAWLGVSTSRVSLALMKQLKIKSGLLVDDVRPGSPAEAAGIKPQDIIQKLDDQILINPAQLEGLVRMHNPGDSVGFTLLHEGDHATVTAKLVEHDVLATQDLDPQSVGALRSYYEAFSPEKMSINVDPLQINPAVPGMLLPSLGSDGNIRIMTATSKSVTSDDGNTTSASFESQYSDGKHQLTMVHKGTEHILTIKDGAGKELFNGPVDTAEQQKNIPADLQNTFREMQKMEHMADDVAKP